MLEVTLGEILEQYRKEQKIKKSQVCSGICTITAYTNYERDERVPDKYLIDCILERLGYDSNLLEFITTDEEFQFRRYRDWLEENLLSNTDRAVEVLARYEKKLTRVQKLHFQYIRMCQGQIKKECNACDEARAFLLEAFAYTQKLDLLTLGIGDNLLSNIECSIYFHIAEIMEKENYSGALFMYRELKKYFQTRMRTEKKTEIYSKVLLKLAEDEAKNKNYGLAKNYLLESEQILIQRYKLSDLKENFLLKRSLAQAGVLDLDLTEIEEMILVLQLLETADNDGMFTEESRQLWENTTNHL